MLPCLSTLQSSLLSKVLRYGGREQSVFMSFSIFHHYGFQFSFKESEEEDRNPARYLKNAISNQ